MAKSKPITVAEWIAYLNTPWPEGWWVEETEIYVGDERIPDDVDMDATYIGKFAGADHVKIAGGYIVRGVDDREYLSLKNNFDAWRRTVSTETIVLTVPKEKVEEIRAFLRAAKLLSD